MSNDAIYQKAARYCSYQERTVQQVRQKLRALGVQHAADEEALIRALQEARYLDEARYVAAYVSGKLRAQRWGKRKIKAALLQKGIAPALVQAGLADVAAEDYDKTIRTAAQQKKRQLPGTDVRQDQQKLTNYLLQKGYESDIVHEVVQALWS